MRKIIVRIAFSTVVVTCVLLAASRAKVVRATLSSYQEVTTV